MVKKTIVRLTFILVFTVLLNSIYTKTLYKKDLKKYSPVSFSIDSIQHLNPEILYLGESSNSTYSELDTNKSSISQMLQSKVPEYKLSSLSHGAYHAGNYCVVLKRIQNPSIKTVIVTMNLRSFGPDWIFSNLETPLQQSMVLLKPGPPLFRKFLLLFKGYDIKTEKEREEQFKMALRNEQISKTYHLPFENTKEWEAYHYSRSDLSKNKKELTCQFIKSYGFSINLKNNPRIKDFDEIVELSKERNWKLIFHVLPENLDLADSLVGKALCKMMKNNTAKLIDRYQKKGVLVVNNLDLASSRHFIDKDFPTEHYDEITRIMIANSLKKILIQH